MRQGSVYLKNFTFSSSLIPDVSQQLIYLTDLKNKLYKFRVGKNLKERTDKFIFLIFQFSVGLKPICSVNKIN